jgi:hypothetical protein
VSKSSGHNNGNGKSVPSKTGQNGNADYKVGPGKPPLEFQFKPGHPGGPGRPKGAAYTLKEWLNLMAEYSVSDLNAVLTDEAATAAKKAAARTWLDATTRLTTSSGVPIAGAEFDRIMDRTEGRPAQAIDLTSGGVPFYKELARVSRDDL